MYFKPNAKFYFNCYKNVNGKKYNCMNEFDLKYFAALLILIKH